MALDPGFGRPVPATVKSYVGSAWGPRDGRNHNGLDIHVPTGTPALTIGDGTVIRVQKTDNGDAGIHIAVRHPSGFVSRYLHLSRTQVEVGQQVTRGQQIGLTGNTGRSSGPHLHFELRVPAAMLMVLDREVGTPSTGWGTNMDPYGYAVPAETWIPIDEYRASSVIKDRLYRVPFYAERLGVRIPLTLTSPRGAWFLGLVVGIGGFLWRERRLGR